MDRLLYFINKLWTYATTIHPLTYLFFLISLGLLFFISEWTIQKLRPQTNKQKIVAAALTIFIGIPVLGLILVFIVELLLKDQPF
jgi:MFS superfamily sulfate permease-like transporter